MFKLVLEKAEEPEIKLPVSAGSWKKQEGSRKTSISALLLIDFKAKAFDCVEHNAAAAAAKSLQSCPTLCDPIDGSPQAPPSLGFSRQEHWSGSPFPSPMHEGEKRR